MAPQEHNIFAQEIYSTSPEDIYRAAKLRCRWQKYCVMTHGIRSTFRDWAGDATDSPCELIEQGLAHTISNKAERAYRRGTAVEKRRALMEAWAV